MLSGFCAYAKHFAVSMFFSHAPGSVCNLHTDVSSSRFAWILAYLFFFLCVCVCGQNLLFAECHSFVDTYHACVSTLNLLHMLNMEYIGVRKMNDLSCTIATNRSSDVKKKPYIKTGRLTKTCFSQAIKD